MITSVAFVALLLGFPISVSVNEFVFFGQQRTSATASIHDDRGTFALETTPGTGLVVIDASPRTFWVLAAGDVITSLNSQVVKTPEEFFQILRESPAQILDCQIQRDGKTQLVELPTNRYKQSLPPAPPTPPNPSTSR